MSSGIRSAVLTGSLLLAAVTQPLSAEPILALVTAPGLTNGLVSFDSLAPGTAGAPTSITGLQPFETLLGIDIRPSTGQVYAIGSTNRLYSVDRNNGLATLLFSLVPNPTDLSDPFSGLSGSFYGMDFNPVPDLAGLPSLRVVSTADQNLRINVDTGQVITDDAINPAVAHIVGSAYSNNDLDPITGTTLYGINPITDMLVTQFPANNGTIANIGPLGVNASNQIGFDISGLAIAYAAISLSGNEDTGPSSFYTIDLTTGAASLVGQVGDGSYAVVGIAAEPVPEPTSWFLLSSGLGLFALLARRAAK